MPLGSNKMGFYRDHLGGAGTAFERQITITPTVSNYDSSATYGSGYQNKLDWNITSNLPNAVVNYELNNASNSMFANGVVSGQVTLDSNGNANLSYDMNVWANYANTNTNISLSIINPNGNSELATSSNVVFGPANTFTANSGNISTQNDHTVHIFDSYEIINANAYANAKVWDDLEVTNTGKSDDPFNYVTVIAVGGGGAGGSGRFVPNTSFGNVVGTGGGGGGGEVIYYKAPGNVYTEGNISITLGNGGRHSFPGGNSNSDLSTIPTPSDVNTPMGGNTTFGFHETTGSLTAHGGAGALLMLDGNVLQTGTNYQDTYPTAWFDIGLGGFKTAANVSWTTPLGGAGAGEGAVSFDLGNSQVNPGYNQGTFGVEGLSQANITTVGVSSEIFIAKGNANVNKTSSRIGQSGSGASNNRHGAGGAPQGGTTVFETPLMGNSAPHYIITSLGPPVVAEWRYEQDTRGISVPQPLPQAGNVRADANVTYWTVGGGGASAPIGGGSRTTTGNLQYNASIIYESGSGGSQYSSTGNANTSFSVEPAARVATSANADYTYHGIRGGGGAGSVYKSSTTSGFNGTNGGEGLIIVYYPTEYMSFYS